MTTLLQAPVLDGPSALCIPEPGSTDKHDFYLALDDFQQQLHRQLRAHYGDGNRAMLLALKAANLLAADYHYRHRHAWLGSRPVQLMIDPSNACQLRCPGCVHSSNPDWAGQFDWPREIMQDDQADRLLAGFGPFASAAVLYNYGEPLLYRGFAAMVRKAKALGLYAMTSSNLSLRLDAPALVASGLDRLIVSADGATQASYQRFRRRGQLQLVLDNLIAIDRAKEAQGSSTPYVVWQHLNFEHNVDQIEAAEMLALQTGVNEIQFLTPFSVAADDPDIRPADPVHACQRILRPWPGPSSRDAVLADEALVAAMVARCFTERWVDRLQGLEAREDAPRAGAQACRWLYHNLTFDAAGRVLPCCITPARDKSLVYAQQQQMPADMVNSPAAVWSRQARAEPDFDPRRAIAQWVHEPYCLSCDDRPLPPYAFCVRDQLRELDPLGVLPNALLQRIEHAELYRHAQGMPE